MDNEMARILSDPVESMQRAADLLVSTGSREEYPQSRERNDDLSVLSAALHYRLLLDPALLFKFDDVSHLIKEIIVCAYLLGRRDDQAVPDAFSEAPDA